MNFELKLDMDDWKFLQSMVISEVSKANRTFLDNQWVSTAVFVVLGVVFMAIFDRISDMHWPSFIAAIVGMSILNSINKLYSARLGKLLMPVEGGAFLERTSFTISEKGIGSKTNTSTGHISWDLVQTIRRGDGMILIFLDTSAALMFPEKKLENPDEFYSYIVKCHEARELGGEGSDPTL